MERRELICIGCPLGCNITVMMEGSSVFYVEGNTCKRGEDYARKEVTCPTRTVTSTVKVLQGEGQVVSCKTKSEIPKEKIMECMAEIRRVVATAPVHIGDVLIEQVAGTQVDVVATKEILLLKDATFQCNEEGNCTKERG